MEDKLKGGRRPYQKPKLEIVQLILEESVLITCKRGGGSGPPGAHNCSPSAPCLKQNPS